MTDQSLAEQSPMEPAQLDEAVRVLATSDDFRILKRVSIDSVIQEQGAVPAEITRVAVLDQETTGLDPQTDGVIELAVTVWDVDSHTGAPVACVGSFESLNDPGMPISPEAEKSTGITQAMLTGQRVDADALRQVCEGVELFIAHNAKFDRPFAEGLIPWMNECSWACSYSDIDWLDLGFGGRSLEVLCMHHGGFYDAHRARPDVVALSWLLLSPNALARQASQQPQACTLMHRLLLAAKETEYSIDATGSPFETKDLLRKRGYRWDGDDRVWCRQGLRSRAELSAEVTWLRENVFVHARADHQVAVYRRDARLKFTDRLGTRTMLTLNGALAQKLANEVNRPAGETPRG